MVSFYYPVVFENDAFETKAANSAASGEGAPRSAIAPAAPAAVAAFCSLGHIFSLRRCPPQLLP